MPFTIPMAGAHANRRTSTPEFKVGTTNLDDSNPEWLGALVTDPFATLMVSRIAGSVTTY